MGAPGAGPAHLCLSAACATGEKRWTTAAGFPLATAFAQIAWIEPAVRDQGARWRKRFRPRLGALNFLVRHLGAFRAEEWFGHMGPRQNQPALSIVWALLKENEPPQRQKGRAVRLAGPLIEYCASVALGYIRGPRLVKPLGNFMPLRWQGPSGGICMFQRCKERAKTCSARSMEHNL